MELSHPDVKNMKPSKKGRALVRFALAGNIFFYDDIVKCGEFQSLFDGNTRASKVSLNTMKF